MIRSLVGWLAWIVMVCASSACMFHYLATRPYAAIMCAALVVGLSAIERPTDRRS